MVDHLDDIASDLSAFHRIDDAGEMEAAVFFTLVMRLPAYSGVLAARLAAEDTQPTAVSASAAGRSQVYEQGSGAANNAATASSAAPLTTTEMLSLNGKLGAGYFSHAAVPGG